MTKDLRNIYNNLFRYLRRELPSEETTSLFDEVEANSEVAENLETFRAAKVLLEENELLDFKQAAKGYAKQAKAKKLYTKIAAAAGIIIAGVALYFVFSENTEKETPVKKTNETTIEKPQITETDTATITNIKEEADTKNTIETDTESKQKTKPEKDAVPAKTEPVSESEENLESDTEANKATEIKQTDEPETTVVKSEQKVKNTETIKAVEPKPENKKVSESKPKKIDPVIEESEVVEEDTDDYWNETEATKDPCEFEVPETYEPSFDDIILITESAISAGSIMIYSEMMKEVYKRNFYEGEEITWDGTNINGENLPMGLYKIILFYQSGDKCTKDITILER